MKNQNPLLHTPEGVRDIYGNEFVQKFELQQLLYRILAGAGYQGIETPTFEFFDVFSREVGTVSSREASINSLTKRATPWYSGRI